MMQRLMMFISVLATVALGIYSIMLTARLDAVEGLVAAREAADPLLPFECTSDYSPCEVSLERLVKFPQYFHGRKVRVHGIYAQGFETSAIHSPVALYRKNEIYDKKTGKLSLREILPEELIWIPRTLPKDLHGENVVVIGLFKRGPSGLMNQYPGELDVQEVSKE